MLNLRQNLFFCYLPGANLAGIEFDMSLEGFRDRQCSILARLYTTILKNFWRASVLIKNYKICTQNLISYLLLI